ncbi:MAG: radical SAM protein [archaeon]
MFGIANLALRHYQQNKMLDKVNYNPTALQIEITTACNLKCTMCEHSFMQEIGKNLNFSEFKKIIDENKNVQVINLTGIGESLLNPEFIEMVKYAKSKGIYVWFNDNFTLMNREKAEKLIDLGADFIILSLDGATKEVYEKIRGGANFEKVTANFAGLRELRDKKNLSNPKLGISMVVLKENYKEIEKMVELAKELKADNLMYSSIVLSDNTGNLSLGNLEEKETMPFVESGKKTAEELKVNVIAWPNVKLKITEKTGCAYPWLNPYIGYNGNVLPCCFIPQMANARMKEENIMGNIFKEPLYKIWNGKKYVEFRKKIKTKNPPVSCRTCSKFYGQ